ncbi:MAG: glycosyltransferase family 2 protein [Chloroflexota bacterium]|nr:glycosyltransferase family 2 protein [Chloroflexota bacterium]
MVLLSVVIVDYRTPEDLRRCLTALHDCRPMPEVIVVDNAASAAGRSPSADLVRAEFPRVVLLTPGRNLWFCGGNNLGVAVAHGKYALLLNPDTIPPPGALAALVAFMEAHPDYAGCTLRLCYPKSDGSAGDVQRTCSQIPTFSYLLWTQTALRFVRPAHVRQLDQAHYYGDWTRDNERDVAALPGSCCLMRRDDLRLNEALWLYFPEDDLARRFAGRKFRFLTSHTIIHREKSATRTALATRVYFRDLLVYTRLHHGRTAAALMWLCSRPLAWGLALRWRLKTASVTRHSASAAETSA